MKAHISVTDKSGTVFEGDVDLSPAGVPQPPRIRTRVTAKAGGASKPVQVELDFAKPERAFVKQYSKGLSGTRKFVLVLAYLAKGVVGKEILLTDIVRHWNRMTARLGAFNNNFTNGAKENAWADTKKKGVYVLCSAWREAFEE
jgi:hypothetical protein